MNIARLMAVLALLAPLGLAPLPAAEASNGQPADPQSGAAAALDNLSDEDKIAQLFLVTFTGSSVDPAAAIFQVLRRYHLGGVVLTRANDNFDDRTDVRAALYALTGALQAANQDQAPSGVIATPTPNALQPLPQPLFIAVAHGGLGLRTDELLSGLTALPSPLAIGATWNPDFARLVGAAAGRELRQLGFNMLLGPNLDVAGSPNPANPGDLGAGVFGGNAFWVGEFGRAYTLGVHAGSGRRVAVIAGTFPGIGSGDRDAVLEVPVVTKPLAELLATDIRPFSAVASLERDTEGAADGFVTGPGLYAGLQGSISRDTRPLAIDETALKELLQRDAFRPWVQLGGLLVSLPLNHPGVRRDYLAGQNLLASNVAYTALMAGNDLLQVSVQDEDALAALPATLGGLVNRYKQGGLFSERVDQAVTRILELKQGLYGKFGAGAAITAAPLAPLVPADGDVAAIAREALTLLAPAPADLVQRLPQPPAPGARIVFLTQTQLVRQCSLCRPQRLPPVDALQIAVERAYGPIAKVRSPNLSSFDFAELADFLSGVVPTPVLQTTETPAPDSGAATATATAVPTAAAPRTPIADALRDAGWVVALLQPAQPADGLPTSFQRLLATRPDLLAGKKLVVFTLGAPYYLDAAALSQITAYYGLFSAAPAFIDVAAQALFQDLKPRVGGPVSVPAAAYFLAERLLPDPAQKFELVAELVLPAGAALTPSPEPTQASTAALTPVVLATALISGATALPPTLPEGAQVNLSTTILLDFNGNIVPDGTQVDFEVLYKDAAELREVFATGYTMRGVARVALAPKHVGGIEIRAFSGRAVSLPAPLLVSNVAGEPAIVVLTLTPSITPSALPAATNTPVPQIALDANLPASGVKEGQQSAPAATDPRDLLSALFINIAVAGYGWYAAQRSGRGLIQRFRLALGVTIGVWLAYDLYVLRAPGAGLLQSLGALAPVLCAAGGGFAALVVDRYKLQLAASWQSGSSRLQAAWLSMRTGSIK